MESKNLRYAQGALVALALGVYVLILGGGGLRAYFTHDDLGNMLIAHRHTVGEWVRINLLYFTPEYRPLGELYYRALYAWFGMNPLPFHIVLLAALMGNVALTYFFVREVTGSPEAGALAALFGAYHTNVQPIFHNTGLCYDIFSFFFFFAAFVYYIRIRVRGALPNVWQTIAIAALYVASINSKEMGVSLSLMLIAWELVYRPPAAIQWIWQNARTGLLLGVMTIPYVLAKFSHDSILTTVEPYHTVYSLNAYMLQFAHFLNEAFYQIDVIQPRSAILILVLTLGIAWFSRSAALRLAWLLAVLGILPVAFVSQRGLSQEIIPAVALEIAGAVFLVTARRLIFGHVPPMVRVWSQAAVFIALGVWLARTHVRYGAWDTDWMTSEQVVTRRVMQELQKFHQPPPKGGRVLVLADPFEDRFGLASTILMQLNWNDPKLQVTRLTSSSPRPDQKAIKAYDWVVSLE